MLTCEEVDNFLYDFHEGQLSYAERIKFKLHLSMCSECRAYVQGYINTIRNAQADIKKTEPVETIPEELIEAILKSRTKK
jgi:predicted anti-sigma-YlaC factor YlaD